MLTVGLPGLYSRGVVSTFKRLKAKTVRLALDQDAASNANGARAIAALQETDPRRVHG